MTYRGLLDEIERLQQLNRVLYFRAAEAEIARRAAATGETK